MALDFNKFADEGNKFLGELATSFGHPEERDKAARKFRAILHAVRDRLPPEESYDLIAQLPMFLKAVYVENWNGKQGRRIKSLDEFFVEVKRYDALTATTDFPTNEDIESGAKVVFQGLGKYVSLGQLEDIRDVLPSDLKFIAEKVLML